MQLLKNALLCLSVLLICETAFAKATLADDAKPHIVMLIGEREYDTKTTLPKFAREHLAGDYRVSFVYANEDDPNAFDGIEKVRHADVLLVSVRRRTLPQEQLDVIRAYVGGGKPVIGIRTASHAFSVRNQDVPEKHAQWLTWDQDVFGGNYTNHYGKDLETTVDLVATGTVPSALLRGLSADLPAKAGGTLYKVSPLAANTGVLLDGEVPGHASEPVAWTFRRGDGGVSFYTSLGHADDFAGLVLPRLLVNAIAWSIVETAKADGGTALGPVESD
ncbi:ThuA domain-containing protein [Allorhodopirellula heiligendammensis]|uniref:Trehalose utilization n=1 Tax=Allorhodopirellula heiligendammensis TaxID=2714739 RepID=A0A5C6BGU2_9BACT|nr:ThuA domain-containing protein [Allorhodopirellula heiligendammensis]TWU10867.1 Trehalose utilization [Allorhodopirellula heiligendammensis]